MFAISFALLFSPLLFLGCHGHRILLLPLPMRSHAFSFHVIGKELEDQGHEVHMIVEKSYIIPKAFSENTSVVYHVYGEIKDGGSLIDVDDEMANFASDLMIGNLNVEFMIEKIKTYNKMVSQDMLMNSESMFANLEKIKFDIVVMDNLFFMKFPVLIAHRLGLPFIIYTNSPDPWMIGTPWLPSIYSPVLDSADKSHTFLRRLTNSLMYLVDTFAPINPPLNEAILNKYRSYGYFEVEDDLLRNTSLFLWPDDPVLDALPPLTTNVILIGGLTLDFTSLVDATSGLPKEFRDFIEVPESKGTIVVSFGSLVRSYPDKIARMFVETFRHFPQFRFVWRNENDQSLALPSNVKVTKWLPQKELLGHKSVELFITHSGINGQFEAIYYGVPMLSVPLIGDQPRNARRIEDRGYGQTIHLPTATVDSLVKLINKVGSVPSFYNQSSTRIICR